MAEGGEIFVLDMGEPVRLLDLVRQYAEQLHLDRSKVRMRYTGLRPGEKLHEALFAGAEERKPTAHPRIWSTMTPEVEGLAEGLSTLYRAAAENSASSVRTHLGNLLPEFEAAEPPPPRSPRCTRTTSDVIDQADGRHGQRRGAPRPQLRAALGAGARAAGGRHGAHRGPLRPGAASLSVRIEATRAPFPIEGWQLLTRGAWAHEGQVVIEDVATSGFDLHVSFEDWVDQKSLHPVFTYRWRPPAKTWLVNKALPTRFALLAREVLVQYPLLWCAGLRDRVPLHASAMAGEDGAVVIAGPGGVGKSTLLAQEVARGAHLSSDNLCVSDGTTVWGLVEPLRLPADVARSVDPKGSRRTSHGRREVEATDRLSAVEPDRVIVLRRGTHAEAVAHPTTPAVAAHSLAAGTYCAGELRRYWPFAATLAAGTGMGPAHPPVTAVATELATRCSCVSLELGREPRSIPSLAPRPHGGTPVDVTVLSTEHAHDHDHGDHRATAAKLRGPGPRCSTAQTPWPTRRRWPSSRTAWPRRTWPPRPWCCRTSTTSTNMEMPSSIAVATTGDDPPDADQLVGQLRDGPDRPRLRAAERRRASTASSAGSASATPTRPTDRRDLTTDDGACAAPPRAGSSPSTGGASTPASSSGSRRAAGSTVARTAGSSGCVSASCRSRSWQLSRLRFGTVGPTNHFVELQEVEEMLDPEAAAMLGVAPGQITLQYHAGGGVLTGELGRLFGRRKDYPRPVQAADGGPEAAAPPGAARSLDAAAAAAGALLLAAMPAGRAATATRASA